MKTFFFIFFFFFDLFSIFLFFHLVTLEFFGRQISHRLDTHHTSVSMGWQLHGTHTHAHGSTSSHPHEAGHTHGQNINVRAAFIHVLGDVLQSIGVFCAAIIIYFKPTWQLADPICTFIFSIIVLCTTITIMKDALLVSRYVHLNVFQRTTSNFLLHFIRVSVIFASVVPLDCTHTQTRTCVQP